jgi:hypothetical protein
MKEKVLKPYLDILQTEPAPSPYPRVLENYEYKINGKSLKWKTYWLDPKNKLDDSRIILEDSENTAWLILNYASYIKPIGTSKILIWYCSSDPVTREYFVTFFDLEDLLPINLDKAQEALINEIKDKPRDNPMSTVSYGFYAEFKNEPIRFTIPNKLSQGKNSYAFPKEFDIEEETIIHGYYQVKSHNYKWDYNPWINPFCILLLKPMIKEIEVICVDWFNTEDWDLVYQWITRIARDPKTQKLVCEGIRIGLFQLDETGKKLDRWIFKEEFYMYPSMDD